MKSVTRCATALCALALAGYALAAKPAEGTFHNDGKDYTVADAVAFHGEHGIEVLFSDKPLDVPQLLSDFTLDDNDQFNMEGAASLRITVYTTDGSSYSLSLRSADGGGGDLRCADGDFLKITRLDDASVAGSFACEEHKVAFDLPLLKDRPGTKLGAGGGDPGKALKAYAAAIQANDFDAYLAHSSPTEAAKGKASAAAGKDELASRFEFLGRVTPPDVDIAGGTQVEDRAWLDFARPDRSVIGTMQMVRVDGRWLVDGATLRQ